jgi:hypothetical protein
MKVVRRLPWRPILPLMRTMQRRMGLSRNLGDGRADLREQAIEALWRGQRRTDCPSANQVRLWLTADRTSNRLRDRWGERTRLRARRSGMPNVAKVRASDHRRDRGSWSRGHRRFSRCAVGRQDANLAPVSYFPRLFEGDGTQKGFFEDRPGKSCAARKPRGRG